MFICWDDVIDSCCIEEVLCECVEVLEVFECIKIEFVEYVSYQLCMLLMMIGGYVDMLVYGFVGELMD